MWQLRRCVGTGYKACPVFRKSSEGFKCQLQGGDLCIPEYFVFKYYFPRYQSSYGTSQRGELLHNVKKLINGEGSPHDKRQSANVHRAKSMVPFQWPKQDQWDPSPPEVFIWEKNVSYINISIGKIIIKQSITKERNSTQAQNFSRMKMKIHVFC